MKESNSLELLNDNLMFHFVPEIGENTTHVNEDVKQYVKHFFEKIGVEQDTKPNSIGLIGDVPTLTNIIGKLVGQFRIMRNTKVLMKSIFRFSFIKSTLCKFSISLTIQFPNCYINID